MNKKGAFLGLNSFIISLIAVIFFVFCISGFVYYFISANNPNAPILNYGNGVLANASHSMNKSLSGLTNTVKEAQDILSDADATPTDYLFLIFREAFDIPLRLFGFIGTSLKSVSSIVLTFLTLSVGLSSPLSIGIVTLFAGLLVVAIFYVIKFIRSGQD